jgi:hypothetical protein
LEFFRCLWHNNWRCRGFLLVLILLFLYPQETPATITSITLTVAFFNALSGSIAYHRLRRIDYRSGLFFLNDQRGWCCNRCQCNGLPQQGNISDHIRINSPCGCGLPADTAADKIQCKCYATRVYKQANGGRTRYHSYLLLQPDKGTSHRFWSGVYFVSATNPQQSLVYSFAGYLMSAPIHIKSRIVAAGFQQG